MDEMTLEQRMAWEIWKRTADLLKRQMDLEQALREAHAELARLKSDATVPE